MLLLVRVVFFVVGLHAFYAVAEDLSYSRSSWSRSCKAMLSLVMKPKYVGTGSTGRYETYNMGAQYWIDDWFYRVRYVKDEDLSGTIIRFDDGCDCWRYTASGEQVPDGQYNFVMDGDGIIYIHKHVDDEASRWGRVHHSSFLHGAPVAAGGELKFLGGKLKQGNTRTGHYARGFWDKEQNTKMADQFLSEVFRRNPAHPSVPIHLWGSAFFLEKPGAEPVLRLDGPD